MLDPDGVFFLERVGKVPDFQTTPCHIVQAWDRWIEEEGGQVVDDITVVSGLEDEDCKVDDVFWIHQKAFTSVNLQILFFLYNGVGEWGVVNSAKHEGEQSKRRVEVKAR